MILASAFALLALGGQPAREEVTRELTQIEQRITETYKAGQCDAWAGFLAPEWTVIHITGATITKAEAVATCRKTGAAIESLASEVMSVQAYGEFAVVTGRTIATAIGPTSQTVTLRFTDVFVRRDGRWRVVASHATRITQ